MIELPRKRYGWKMRNDEFVIEQYRGGKMVRSFTPSDDKTRPWRMEVNGRTYLRTSGWVLSKILPTLVEGSSISTTVLPRREGMKLADDSQ